MYEPRLHFGGPDKPPRTLRNLLRERIDAVPSGGDILWSTYYFRDRDLARSLIEAHHRGVRVILHIEGLPRRIDVNREVISMLRDADFGKNLRIHTPRIAALKGLHPHLHSKIYLFSHPEQTALVGSFNPSGDDPENTEIIAEIGDQDRGHNVLVEYRDPTMVEGLRRHVLGLDRRALRFHLDQNRALHSTATTAWFYPRLRPGVIDRHLATIGIGCRIKGAISHLKQGFLADGLIRAARSGAEVSLIVHDTERRVPGATVAMLADAGVAISRYIHADRLPLHAKFLLIDEPKTRTAYFGSFNYNPRSRWLNREILIASTDPFLHHGLSMRFEHIRSEGLGA